jgi:phenylalanyl-tRNA synthetase beta chain
MQISLKWVNELVTIETTDLEYLIEKLTFGGFEVEEILQVEINNQKTISLDISATPNRSDSLSIQGISTEIAALLNTPSKISNYSIKNLNWKEQIDSLCPFVENQNDYSRFLAITVENVTNFTIPEWLKQKLIYSGITPVNNLLDFQNYLLLETGYPFEFYDLDKIYSKLKTSKFNIIITNQKNEEEFFANNNLKYNLNSSILTVRANELPLSIAGIISNKDFCYSNTTKSLLIEASIFNSTKIRQQSRMLGLRTDRSARYEKSIKDSNLVESFYRLISLLKISNPNLTCKLHTVSQTFKQNLHPISLRYKTINEILGPVKESSNNGVTSITTDTITNYLDRLNFTYTFDNSKLIWKVDIPYLRSEDITREIDLIEEIGRLHGFNNFLTRLPKIKTIGIEDYSYQTRKRITSCLLNLGFTELIHYSLVNQTTFLNNPITLINPLLSDCSNLRSSLLPNLLKTIQENLKQGNSSIEGFEYGHIFSGSILPEFQEKEYIAGIFGSLKIKRIWSEAPKSLTWFEGKGKMEQFFKQLNILTYWKTYSSSKYSQLLHPYCTAELYLQNQTNLGVFGQIHPIVAKKLNVSPELYLFEFDFEQIKNQIQTNKLSIYQEYSFYPKIVKDLSFIIHQNISFEEIREILYCNGTKFLVQINLLDEYRGNSIPENQTSLCFQLIFQSNEKTLQNKEVESTINNLQLLLTKNFNATIRL